MREGDTFPFPIPHSCIGRVASGPAIFELVEALQLADLVVINSWVYNLLLFSFLFTSLAG